MVVVVVVIVIAITLVNVCGSRPSNSGGSSFEAIAAEIKAALVVAL